MPAFRLGSQLYVLAGEVRTVLTANCGVEADTVITGHLVHGGSDVRVPPRIAAALSRLADAQWYTTDTGLNVWEFAVEIGSLGLRANDLRWLIHMGLVEHGWEITRVGVKTRSFRPDMGITLSSRSCFVATAAGLSLVDTCSARRAR